MKSYSSIRNSLSIFFLLFLIFFIAIGVLCIKLLPLWMDRGLVNPYCLFTSSLSFILMTIKNARLLLDTEQRQFIHLTSTNSLIILTLLFCVYSLLFKIEATLPPPSAPAAAAAVRQRMLIRDVNLR